MIKYRSPMNLSYIQISIDYNSNIIILLYVIMMKLLYSPYLQIDKPVYILN